MAVIAGIVFIHPKDFEKLIHDSSSYIMDILSYDFYDGHNVKEMNGIIYRETTKVPEVLEN